MSSQVTLVSVIIPTFNRAKFVTDAIESVLKQSYENIEMIIVDDGSTDETPPLLQRYSDRAQLIRTENRGVSAARNTGFKQSKGELVCFLDSDDYWLEKKVERQIDYFARHPEMHICQTGEIWIRHGRRVNPKKKHRKLDGWIYERSLELCIVTPSAVMMKRSLLDDVGLFDEEMPVCEDYDLWLRIASQYPIGLIEENLVVKHGGHEDQLSDNWGLDRWRVFAMEKMLKSGALTESQKKETIAELINKCRIYSQGCEKREKLDEAVRFRNKINHYALLLDEQ